MAPRKPYSIYKRPSKVTKKNIYYVQFRGPDGVLLSGVSSGCTSRTAAEAWAIAQLQKLEPRENPTFSEFSENFFDYNGDWALNRRSTGKRLSIRQCRDKAAMLSRVVLPAVGDLRLRDITRGDIDRFRNGLYQRGYAGSSINQALSIIRPILEKAEDLKIITSMPRIERAALHCKKKDIFTMAELRALFAVQWDDFRMYVLNMVAASTGIRRGELMALQVQDIEGDFIRVSKSWDITTSTTTATTKSGRTRYVIIPARVQVEIARLIELNPWKQPESYIFFSTMPDKPIEAKIITRELYKAMRKIGIPEGERVRRNLTFHSWRHLFNSILVNARVPAEKIRSVTGHLTAEMTSHYYHLSADGYQDIRRVQAGIFTDDGPETVN